MFKRGLYIGSCDSRTGHDSAHPTAQNPSQETHLHPTAHKCFKETHDPCASLVPVGVDRVFLSSACETLDHRCVSFERF